MIAEGLSGVDMFKIRTPHPVRFRRFTTRAEAERVAGLWGLDAPVVPARERTHRVPAAHIR
jgi:hypothetical protein